jgi:acetyltransferase-like isoleucine patch superfamily enzyme
MLTSRLIQASDKIIRKLRGMRGRLYRLLYGWYLGGRPVISRDITVNGAIFISDPNAMAIGRNVHIGAGAHFRSEGGLAIGDNAHISHDVTIYTVTHEYEGERIPYDTSQRRRPVVVGKNAWIGRGVKIAPGTTVGEGAIVGLGCTVQGEIEACEIVSANVPRMEKKRYRDRERYKALVTAGAFAGNAGSAINTRSGHVPLTQFTGSIIFAVSTGRAGSEAFARLLNQAPQVVGLHEPRHELIGLSTDIAHGRISEKRVEAYLEHCFKDISIVDPSLRIYAESDHKYWNMVPLLARLLPSSSFVFLVREPEHFVASAYSRGWFVDDDFEFGKSGMRSYSNMKWATNRLAADKMSLKSTEEWRQMSSFERCCWYWTTVNDRLVSDLSMLERHRVSAVWTRGIGPLVDKLLVNAGMPSRQVRTGRQVSNKAFYSVINSSQWTDSQREIFSRTCVPALERVDRFVRSYSGEA